MYGMIPDFKVGDLVCCPGEDIDLALLVRIYDHETGEGSSLSDAKNRLLAAEVEVKNRIRHFFLHELEPIGKEG